MACAHSTSTAFVSTDGAAAEAPIESKVIRHIPVQFALICCSFPQGCYQCSFPNCTSAYTRRYRLWQHEEAIHGVARVTGDKKNFICPFGTICGEKLFRTNVELIHHCDEMHKEKLGILDTPTCLLHEYLPISGLKELSFVSMNDFQSWKEREEEATYSTYVKGQKTYHPSCEGE